MKGKIVIADYNSQWPTLFEQHKQRILQATRGLVIAIEHIGSTAVVGLAAKPVIDIMPGVKTLADADTCVEAMVGLGYTYIQKYESMMPERRFFNRNVEGEISQNVHMVVVNGEFWERHLLFRDYLRTHPDTVEAYARIKRELAPQFDDTNDYAKAKTEFITGMVAEARKWKESLS